MIIDFRKRYQSQIIMVINAIQLRSEEIQRKTEISEIRKIKRVTGDKARKNGRERKNKVYVHVF